MEKDIRLVEQIATFKRLPKSDNRWRVAFYYIAKELWELEEIFVVFDKELYKKGLKIPVFREYNEAEGFQLFSNYSKACNFVQKNKNLFEVDGEKLIGKIRQGAFREVFVPFFSEQKFNYILNEDESLFIDTFTRLLAVMEADENYIVDEEQEAMLKAGNIQQFFADICDKYIVLV
ncbi:hypothetical protein HMPREF1983_00904 [Gemella bergeri ATCC 700627]|uniref:Uncharacterized protein n=1 Tax=Gemella bergeri ATCC 700627 TaxID=1321820 RepID=U2Q5N4_9BACL|nr:hypothetical protein [Gemella bergeri]ERK58070.1 hypothetical protein HMPREF1983_00904 [Gemella bergeri ATCC 700627]